MDGQSLQDQISELLKPHRVCLMLPVFMNRGQSFGRSANRFVVLSLWRGYLVLNKQLVRVETSFSYLEICSITIHSLSQIVLETDTHILSFGVLHVEDLEAMVGHLTASLKRIFPDSSPGKLLKTTPADLQLRLSVLSRLMEERLDAQPGPCGGFSDTYAALCDFNQVAVRDELQWDVDNIYQTQNCRHFNLNDFSHLDSRDLALAVAALSFNQWFTKISSKELKLSVGVQQQLTFLLSRSPSLEELCLESSGLKVDFVIKLAAALRDHTSSTLQCINLSDNQIEDKGVIALSQALGNLAAGLRVLSLSQVSMTARGVGCLCEVLSNDQLFSVSLTHLDLSGNPGSLATEEATFLFRFLSSTNSLSHLDLSGTSCPLDTLFVSLSAGCCSKLMHLNLSRNPFSHRRVRSVTRSVREFFSQSRELKYVNLSATKLPPPALRFLLQGLATNSHLCGLELDISSCELGSAGAQVIQEHICEATVITSLDISDNGLENDMVTLILSVGRCRTLQHLALGRNFPMKSRALSDVLHRIAQLVQDEDSSIQSLSVRDSKLKTGIHILISALGGHATLTELDISGNAIGDTGAKMLAKALMSNTTLRCLTWDRNNVTFRGFQDVADALERNFTLQQVSLPLTDITQSYRANPDRTKDALHKIQQCLRRNNQRRSNGDELQPTFPTRQSDKLLQGLCQQLDDDLQRLTHCSVQEVQSDILTAWEVLHSTRETLKLLPSLHEAGSGSDSDRDVVTSILSEAADALTNDFTRNIQDGAQVLLSSVEGVCPHAVQHSSVCERFQECVSMRHNHTHTFVRSVLVERMGPIINSRLRELRRSLTVSLTEVILERLLDELRAAQRKVDLLLQQNLCTSPSNNIPELQLLDADFPTDDYSPAFWRSGFHCSSLRPAPSIKSLMDADWERGLPQLVAAAPLSVMASSSSLSPSPSPSTSPSPPGWRRRQRWEGEAAADAAAAVSGGRGAPFLPPPSLPLLSSARAPEEEAARRRGLHRPEVPFVGCSSSPGPGPLPGSGSSGSLMEPLPTQGQALRHYTASRPRPRRTHSEPPSSRPQEPASKVDDEADDTMGRVDEGVEEFFTKKILPDYTQKARWEESNPAQSTPSESSSTPSASIPFSSSSENVPSSTTISITSSSVPLSNTPITSTDVAPLSPPPPPTTPSVTTSSSSTLPTKNIKKKFGDFFAFKRARAGRAAKAGGGEGGGEGVRVKRTSIADLIRPLREAKERERERDKERGTRSVEDANVSNDAAMTEGTAAVGRRLAGEESVAPGKTVTTATPPSEPTPSYPITTTTTTPDLTKVTLSNLEEEAITAPAVTVTPEVKMEEIPYGDQRLKATKRSLREGKSQSLILLTGLEPEDKDNAHSKKHASESTSSFEQRLQVMLHRMGVAKTPPTDVKTSQNKDEELRKANSEGTILDKPRPPPTYMKPRTMSTSSADSRHPTRVLDSVRPEPPLHPKPVLPERPVGRLPPKPPIAAKPTLPAPAAPAGEAPLSSAPPSSGSAERDHLGSRTLDSKIAQTEVQEGLQGAASAPSPRKELPPPVPSPWRGPSAQARSEKAQSVTDESLPNPRTHLKPLPQRRAVSVHEDALSMTQEPKAVLQRSPVRFRGNRSDLPTCSEDPSGVEEAPRAAVGPVEPEVQDQEDVVQGDEVKADGDGASCRGTGVEIKRSPPGEDEASASSSSESSRVHGDRTPSTLDRPPARTQTPPLPPTSHEKSPVLGLEKLPVLSPSQEKILSTTENLENSRASPSTGSGTVGSSTEEGGAAVPKQHTTGTQPADQRTDPPQSE